MAKKKSATKKKTATAEKTRDTTGPAKAVPAATLKYVTASARLNLGEGLHAGVTVREEAGALHFAYEGVDYASLRFDGGDLEIRFRKPSVLDDWERRKAHFREDRTRSGWLIWRTPIKRDPRPWLDAGIGSTIGRTVLELKQR
jgi:hypothetical protein